MDEMNKDEMLETLMSFISQSVPSRWVAKEIAEFDMPGHIFTVEFEYDDGETTVRNISKREYVSDHD